MNTSPTLETPQKNMQEVIFENLTSVSVHSAYFTIIGDDGMQPVAAIVLDPPMPVMNYVLEKKASSV